MRLRDLFSVCLFGHAEDPIKVLKGKRLHFECVRCHQDLGVILPKQKFKQRKEVKKVLPFGQRKEKIITQSSRRA